MNLVEGLAHAPIRCNFAFTPDGRHVARLTDRDGALAVEVLDLDGASRRSQRVYGPNSLLSFESELSFPEPDRLRICSRQDGWFRVLEARRSAEKGADGGWTCRPIAERQAARFRLLASADGAGLDLAISLADDATSTIWRIEDGQPLQALVRVPGVLTGGVWLDPWRRLAINIHEPGRPASGYVIDLRAQTYHRWFHISDHSNDLIELYDDERGLLGVTSDCCGYRRVGIADLESARQVRFLSDVPGENPWVDLCGQVEGGLVLRRQRGMVTELWLGDPRGLGVFGPLNLAPGLVSGPVVQSGDRIRFPFSGPTTPMLCSSYRSVGDLFDLDEPVELGGLSESDLAIPRIVSFPGPRGDIEALVYQPPASRRRPLMVMALHGGPVGQWSAAFTPELQLLAGLGALVVAPNYRGSSGYGDAFMRALEGSAGSVDFDDVVAVMNAMGSDAGPGAASVVLYGHSYGAFLALLVAATHPDRCDGVIAVSPFTSLSAVRSAGMPSVRRLVDLLVGPGPDADRADVLRLCGELQAKVLIAHGGRDRVVPIEQSHLLRDRLLAAGYRESRDLRFLPLPEEGHLIAGRAARLRLYRQIESFLDDVVRGPEMVRLVSRTGTGTQDRTQEAGGRAQSASEAFGSVATSHERRR
jgi:pimeloyl-ACP methyl ester carboxylesterase